MAIIDQPLPSPGQLDHLDPLTAEEHPRHLFTTAGLPVIPCTVAANGPDSPALQALLAGLRGVGPALGTALGVGGVARAGALPGLAARGQDAASACRPALLQDIMGVDRISANTAESLSSAHLPRLLRVLSAYAECDC